MSRQVRTQMPQTQKKDKKSKSKGKKPMTSILHGLTKERNLIKMHVY